MTTKEAIAMLRRIQDPEPYEPRLSENAVTALGMGIKALEMSDQHLIEISNAYVNGYRQGKFEARQEQNSEWGKTALGIVEKIDRYATLDIAAVKWVPCSERLPEFTKNVDPYEGEEPWLESDPVLVQTGGATLLIAKYMHDPILEDGWVELISDFEKTVTQDIVAWRKLPKPYKGDKE